MQLSIFSRDSRLPCKVSKIVTNIKRRKLNFDLGERLGLAKDVLAIPFSRGFVLCCKDIILFADNTDLLHRLNGTFTFSELIARREDERALEQLFYYNLISSGFSKGKLKEFKIDPRYSGKYQNGDFVIFSMVPLAVELNITNKCNFNCIHCSKNSQPVRSSNELSTSETLCIIDKCLQVGVPELRFMGGEPLIHPDFLGFAKHARENGVFQLKLSTNAWLIDDQKAKELAKYFDSVQISVHGASPVVHDAIVGRSGAWEQAKRAVALLSENGVKANIGFSVMRENVGDVSKMPELALGWNADSLGYLCLIPQGRGMELESWEESQILRIGKTIQDLKLEFGSQLNLDVAGFPPIYPIKENATIYGCEAGKTLLAINPDGSVKLCGILENIPRLNAVESQLLEIWHSPYFVESRRRSQCADCNYTSICWGPCKFLSK